MCTQSGYIKSGISPTMARVVASKDIFHMQGGVIMGEKREHRYRYDQPEDWGVVGKDAILHVKDKLKPRIV